MLKYKKYIFPSIFLSSIFFVVFSFFGDTEIILSLLKSISFYWFVLLLTLSFSTLVFRFFKWHFYLKLISKEVSLKESILVFASSLSLSFTPGKVGDLLKSYLLKEKHQIPISESATIVLVERITDIFSLLIILLIGTYFFQKYQITIYLVSIVFILIILVLSNVKFGKYLTKYLGKWKLFKTLVEPFKIAYRTSSNLLSSKNLFLMTVMSLFAWSFELLSFYLILLNLNVQISLFDTSFIYSLSTVIGSISMLPAGIGFTDVSLTYLLVNSGISENIAITSMILMRIITLWFSIILGLLSMKYLKNFGYELSSS